MPYLDIINACAYNVYQALALYREPGDEARYPATGGGIPELMIFMTLASIRILLAKGILADRAAACSLLAYR